MTRRIILALSLALSLAACGSESADPAPASPEAPDEPTAVAEPTAAEEDEPEVTEDEFPIAEDFEEEAEASITAENLEEQIAALEAELNE